MKLRPFSAALVAGVSLAAAPATFAQTAGGVTVAGAAIANQQAVITASNAYKTAIPLLQVTYKAQIDQARARAAAIRAQIKPLFDKFNADRKAPKPDVAVLQTEYGQIQQIQQAGQQDIDQIIQPVNLARAYIVEQITDKLDAATQGAMTKRRVTVVFDAQSILKADQVYNINQDIVDQLNTLVPSVSVTPPAGWLPRQQREQQAQEQAAAAAEAAADSAAAPAKSQPQGR